MSDDIVARLRAGSYLYNEETRNTEHIITKNERLAADEIDRLRGEVERLTRERDYWARARNEWEKSAGLLEEENKRLTRNWSEAITANANLASIHFEEEASLRCERDAALARAEAAEAKVAKLRGALKDVLFDVDCMIEHDIITDVRSDVLYDRARTALQETEQ